MLQKQLEEYNRNNFEDLIRTSTISKTNKAEVGLFAITFIHGSSQQVQKAQGFRGGGFWYRHPGGGQRNRRKSCNQTNMDPNRKYPYNVWINSVKLYMKVIQLIEMST